MWVISGRTPGGDIRKVAVDDQGRLIVSGVVSGGASGGTSDTTEATAQLIQAAVQNIDVDLGAAADAPATNDTGAFTVISLLKRGLQRWTSLLDRLPASLGGKTSAASLPVVIASDQAAVPISAAAIGAPADARAAWYDSAASVIQLLKLSVAAFVRAGSRSYNYTNGVLTSEAWTLFGTTRTKTYTYTGGVLTGESDWVA